MRWRALMLLVVAGAAGCKPRASPPADSSAAPTPAAAVAPRSSADLAYVCPMDRDIRSSAPGTCPRCGMTLVAEVPDPLEYHVDLTTSPDPPEPGRRADLTFHVFDPWKGNPVSNFSTVHEKLFHAFIVSRDLSVFIHDHPVFDGTAFHYATSFPKSGMYRILTDFYPEGATPQLLTKTLFVAGQESFSPKLTRELSTKTAENLTVSLSISPPDPVAGGTTQLRFSVKPVEGLEKLLGAWGHLLAASDDLIDMIHTHPAMADGSSEMQFAVIFPRTRFYRVWVQFQRSGLVNTAHFDIPVGAQRTERPSN